MFLMINVVSSHPTSKLRTTFCWCLLLLIQDIRSYPPYLKAISSIHNLRRTIPFISIQIMTYHFIRNMSSPLESVAPIIFSGSNPRSNPLGLLSSYKAGKLQFSSTMTETLTRLLKHCQKDYCMYSRIPT